MATTPQAASSSASLHDLPNEILLQIFSYVDAHRSDRILGHIPDDPPPNPPDDYLLKDFLEASSALSNIALACKRFYPLATEQLFFAPVLGLAKKTLDVLRLVRIFAAHPDRARHVNQLRLSLPLHGCDVRPNIVSDFELAESLSNRPVILEARDIIDTLAVPEHVKTNWHATLPRAFADTLFNILYLLLPHLELLCISVETPENEAGLDDWTCACSSPANKLPNLRGLTYLKIESLLFRGDDFTRHPRLHVLDLSLRLVQQSQRAIVAASERFSTSKVPHYHRSIRHLRFDFQTKTVGIWHPAARTYIASVLRAFEHLQSLDFYAEPSDSKNPYSSVRAFPHYQANIQNYPNVLESMRPEVEDQNIWDQRIYDARTEITDYQYLVDTLIHMRPSLEKLRLPGGFWTLPGGMRKPLPRFNRFVRLRKLVVPQAAIIPIKLDNMRFDDVSGDFELFPAMVLPPSIQDLTIFDVDEQFFGSHWLASLFHEQRNYRLWPELKRVQIGVGSMVLDDELENLLARKVKLGFWESANEATFDIEVGRDNNVPSVDSQW